MHQKRHFPRSGVVTIFFDLWFVPGRHGERRKAGKLERKKDKEMNERMKEKRGRGKGKKQVEEEQGH